MLQQTRVGAVLECYALFLRRFPDVNRLAAARLSDVLAAWSGLGYYRRARALHRAARVVLRDHEGNLPAGADALRALPGIGRYTAAAIASIAFHQPCAVVDGNVERVLRRIFGWLDPPVPLLWHAAETLLSRRSPGNFNQAIMELGATVCLPLRPRCEICPIRLFCATQGSLPRARRMARKSAIAAYGLAVRRPYLYLVRRSERERLMPGMWELPPMAATGQTPEFTLRHAITVTDYAVHVYRAGTDALRGGRWVHLRNVADLSLTGLARKILRRVALI